MFQIESSLALRDLIQLLMVIILWAICYPLITTGLSAFPPFHFAALRSFIAGISLLVIGRGLKRPLLPENGVWGNLVVASLTFTALGFIGMFLAGGRVTPGLATVIANAQPLLAALLGYFMLTEKLTLTRGVALLVGFAGIVVIAFSGLIGQSSNSTPEGIGLVLVGVIGVAIGNIVLKRIASQVDPVIAMAWILLLGALPLAGAAVVFEQESVLHWGVNSVVNLLVLSVFGTALAFLGWLDLLRRVDLNLLNTYTFLAPVFALLIGIAFYDERLLASEWFGVGIIVLSMFMAGSKLGIRQRD